MFTKKVHRHELKSCVHLKGSLKPIGIIEVCISFHLFHIPLILHRCGTSMYVTSKKDTCSYKIFI